MLQFWLPLHKNLNNNGLLQTTITNSGAILSAGAYQFDGVDDYISVNGIADCFKGGTNPFSVSFWFYHSGNSRRGVLFGDYGLVESNRINLEITAANKLRFWWDGSPDWTCTNFTLTTQTWYHCVFVYDGSSVKLYINGELSDTRSGALTAKTPSGNYYLGRDVRTGATAFYGKLSDFRIYNHDLSIKEIKELSKGLLLHYTFNDSSIEPTTNLVTRISSSNTRVTISGRTATVGTAAGDSYFAIILSTSLTSGETYNISYDVEMAEGDRCTFGFYYNSKMNHNHTLTNGHNSYTVTPTTTLATITFDNTNRSNANPIKLSNFQIEKKNHETQYVIGSRTPTILYDNSGMGNDAIIGGSFVIEPNSGARYEYCTKFNSNYLLTDDVLTSDNKQMTISVWLKPTVNQTGCIWNGRSTTGYSFGVFYLGGGIRFDDNGGQMQCSTQLPLNQWTHVVCTWETGGQKKVYYNGVLKTSATAGANSHTNTKATIGTSSTGDVAPSGNEFKGYMSDYRIYRKALSIAEVLNLYQDSVIIDNKQDIFAYEFIETSNENTHIVKNGNFKIKNTINEDSDAKIFKNGNIEAKQIYEY